MARPLKKSVRWRARALGAGATIEAKISHLPFLRRERAMQRFRQMRSLQMFISVHTSATNRFNLECSLTSRSNLKLNRSAALTE